MEYTSWESVPLEVMSDMISRKIVTGDKAMVAQVFLKKDAVVPEHHHDSEQITYILEGALKFEIEGKEIVVRKGEVLSIPPTFRIGPWRSKTPSISTSSLRSAPTGSPRTTRT